MVLRTRGRIERAVLILAAVGIGCSRHEAVLKRFLMETVRCFAALPTPTVFPDALLPHQGNLRISAIRLAAETFICSVHEVARSKRAS